MATKSAIGRLHDQALIRLTDAMQTLAGALDVAPVDVAAIRFRDPAYQAAARLEALATWAEALAAAVDAGVVSSGPTGPIPLVTFPVDDEIDDEPVEDAAGLDTLTINELRSLAKEAGVDLSVHRSKQAIIDALQEDQ